MYFSFFYKNKIIYLVSQLFSFQELPLAVWRVLGLAAAQGLHPHPQLPLSTLWTGGNLSLTCFQQKKQSLLLVYMYRS